MNSPGPVSLSIIKAFQSVATGAADYQDSPLLGHKETRGFLGGLITQTLFMALDNSPGKAHQDRITLDVFL